MKRLTYWCDDGMGSGEWRVNVKKYEDSGTHVDRLAAIEDILGDEYGIERVQQLVEEDRKRAESGEMFSDDPIAQAIYRTFCGRGPVR